MSETIAHGPDFSRGDGLLPVIAQEAESGEVLMLAYMNAESYAETLATGKAVYYSRSRNQSGQRRRKRKRADRPCHLVDCDRDTILLSVDQVGGAGLPRRLQELLSSDRSRPTG